MAFYREDGEPHADKILWELRHVSPEGLSRNEIREDVLNKRVSKTDTDIALEILLRADLVLMRHEQVKHSFRLVGKWYLKI